MISTQVSVLLGLSLALLTSACGSNPAALPPGGGSGGGGCAAGGAPFKIIRASTTVHDGSFGNTPAAAMMGADAHCVADFGSGYKALLGSSVRQAPCTDWPLAANQEYRRADGVTIVGTTTTDAVFAFPLNNSVETTAGFILTGLLADWTLGTTCGDWMENQSGGAQTGQPEKTSDKMIYSGAANCAFARPIYCVEQ